jgi:hypothetical protein
VGVAGGCVLIHVRGGDGSALVLVCLFVLPVRRARRILVLEYTNRHWVWGVLRVGLFDVDGAMRVAGTLCTMREWE